ncbi:phosphohistidine phosphatase [Cyclobacterium lianum]|uniref:Phosphohistidine phosphatase n=1 Tax=Cyclobacterium lianum TaxID=388280 RepID=A0A1M7PDH3_9BACT|nr:histidine phosphatase family protein [Cyclobacterium lianum]SHN14995.1 phosphohistidine phosphatase [Cyclobacterium lianum]
MKKLLICRHAKSSWDQPWLSDRERPLAQRGLRDAPVMAKRLKTNHIFPNKIVSSNAKRALQTAEIYQDEFSKEDVWFEKTPELYHASVREILQLLRKQDNRVKSLFIFGHNPGFTDLINYLGEPLDSLPTAAVFGFTFTTDQWTAISPENASFWFYDFPKNQSPKIL